MIYMTHIAFFTQNAIFNHAKKNIISPRLLVGNEDVTSVKAQLEDILKLGILEALGLLKARA